MSTATLGRLLEVIRRTTGAPRVELIDAALPAPDGAVRRELPSGRSLLVHVAPGDEALEARLDALLASFGGLLDEARDDWGEPGNDAVERGSLPDGPPDRGAALVAELAWLAGEAGASEALVIDAHSPVVWGSSHGLASEEALGAQLRLVTSDTPEAPDTSALSDIARQAVREVRARPEIAQLARGGHLRLAEMTDERGLLARSFADIYLLLLLYPGRFDEVAAERLLHASLPRIEHWVLGLPPPAGPEAGGGGAQAARNPRR